MAGLLRWTSSYGTAIVGQKFAWVGDKRGFGPDDNLLIVEIAIPRLGQGQGLAPMASLGNPTASQIGESGEQLIILCRETTGGACNSIANPGECHYILLNGESGDAYGRGEGHEQADQAQLLYYIEGASILMDSGYDRARGVLNSTWNHYADHNVLMQALTGEGGLPPPIPNAAVRKDILVVNPSYLYRTTHGNIDALHVAQRLPHFITQPNGQQWPADCYREVLFIDGVSPYLIDYNRGKHYQSFGTNPLGDRQFKVSYHVNSNVIQLNNFASTGSQFIYWNSVRNAGKNAYPPKLLWNSFPTDRYQGWVWKKDANTYDVFVGRSIGDTAPQLVAFNLRNADASYPNFTFNLPADKSYGFARLQYNSTSGIWQVQANYLLHLVPTTTTYTSNTTIGATTFTGDVILANNVVLTITGAVTINPGVTVLLGSNAQIKVQSSGKITAQGTSSNPIRFVRAGTSAWKEITLSAGGNLFDYVVFDGGTKTVEVVSQNNTFRNSRFKNGWRGISSNYVTGSTSTRSSFTLENCFVENNSTVGVVAYNSNPIIKRSTIQNNGEAGLYLYNASTSTFHRNVITGNCAATTTRSGVEMYNTTLTGGSDVAPFNRAYNRIINNAHHEFQVEGTSSLSLGYTTGLWGINTVYDTGTIASGEKLIYAATGTSVTAHNTYWKNQNVASNFQGVPSTAYAYPISYDSSFVAGAGLSAPVPLRVAPMEEVNIMEESVLSLNQDSGVTTASDVEAATIASASQASEALRRRMQEIRNLLAENPTAPENAQLLRELFQLLRIDATNALGERMANKSVFADFRNRLAALSSTTGLTPTQREALREAGEAAVLVDVQDAIWDERYTEARDLIRSYGNLVQTPDHERILLLNQITLLEQQQRYAEALTLFEQFKALQPEDAFNPDYTPGNYDIIEESLREMAGSAGKTAGEGISVEAVQASLEALPSTFSLDSAYPNPFNPVTLIPFALPEATHVTVEVFDIMGRRITTLTDGVFEAGKHQIVFDASRHASGIYLVRARMVTETDSYVFSQKISLVK